ncbi:hypothetical protein [Flavisericum labens]|uniref:hypothetical protein n=1 Tax=Flavisericum labens TaxID=3377112 RepID=UPI00387AA914
MKCSPKLVVFLSLVLLFMSCSKDSIEESNQLFGVWEAVMVENNTTNTFKLVFAPENEGLKISESFFSSGAITSSATSFNWNESNNVITIMDDTLQEKYLINSDGELVQSTSEDILLEKISNDYSVFLKKQ